MKHRNMIIADVGIGEPLSVKGKRVAMVHFDPPITVGEDDTVKTSLDRNDTGALRAIVKIKKEVTTNLSW